MFGSNASVGDKVALTRTTAVSLTDVLTGGGLPRGTRGVVVGRAGSRLRVRFTAFEGTVEERDTRLVHRGYGVERFTRKARVTTAIRAGVLFAFAAPFLFFAITYVWMNHATHGLLPALLNGVVQGAVNALTASIAHPVQAVVYTVVVSLVWRWARLR